jgi:hypothetical protein
MVKSDLASMAEGRYVGSHTAAFRADVPQSQLLPSPVLQKHFELLGSYSDSQHSWSHIVAGRFSDSYYSGLLFYAQNTGDAEIYQTDGSGGISLLQSHSGLRTSCTHVVPGMFGQSELDGLLLYDQNAGVRAFYDNDPQGGINPVPMSEDDTWRTTWSHIVTGHFKKNSRTSDLLFYDQSNGFGALYSTDGHGGMILLKEYDDWRTSWTHITTGFFRGPYYPDTDHPFDLTDILFYEDSSGYSEVRQSSNLDLLDSKVMAQQVSNIIPGSFGAESAGVLLYEQSAGRGTVVDFWNYDNMGNKVLDMHDGEIHYGWRNSWDMIVSGNFWMADEGDINFPNKTKDQHIPCGAFSDLFFYDRKTGYGEFYLHEPPNSTYVDPLSGYASVGSVRPGESIGFHISSILGDTPPRVYNIKVLKQDVDELLMMTIPLPTRPTPQPISHTAWRDGANWPENVSLTIPDTWLSGLYIARVEATLSGVVTPHATHSDTVHTDIPFIVRAMSPGSQAKILVALVDTTYEAYNPWGGRCLYGFGTRNNPPGAGGELRFVWTSPGGAGDEELPWAFRVSFRRPQTGLFEKKWKWTFWEVPFIRWLARQGISVEWCTMTDLHRETDLLQNYKLFVNVGHSEYWSKEMRDNVEQFVENGGNAAFFAGNVCWWQVRFEDDGCNTMVCYKRKDLDPVHTNDIVTVNWDQDPVNRSSTALTGVKYYGKVWANDTITPIQDRVYIVTKASHWVFDNTGANINFGLYVDANGHQQTVVGAETDAKVSGPPPNGSPYTFSTLARVVDFQDHNKEAATMGIFTNHEGTVFTASTMNWTLGLSQGNVDALGPLDKITLNVLRKLGHL